jgi:hypothetical protein
LFYLRYLLVFSSGISAIENIERSEMGNKVIILVIAALAIAALVLAIVNSTNDNSKTVTQVAQPIGAVAPAGLVGPLEVPDNIIDKTYSRGECAKNFCWTCNSPVSLDSVAINIDTNDVRLDAVKFTSKCSGKIGNLSIVTQSGDGLKVADAHDLEIFGGTIKCISKLPTLHQDAVQVMGGQHIHFHQMVLDCGRQTDNLIDSNFFINMAGGATSPPDDVTCDHCWIGPYAASSVNLQDSTSSGVWNSTICPGKFFNFRMGAGAVNPVNENNKVESAC